MAPPPTPSQTVGPFFAIELPRQTRTELVPADDPDAVRIRGTVFDGDQLPVSDAMVELWQANRYGRYAHPDDAREDVPLEDGFDGFGRSPTDADGGYEFVTVKPGPVPAPGGGMQAPHVDVSVFARGLLKRVVTRIYFPDEPAANEADLVLSSLPGDGARATLVARPENGALRFDIHLQGELETQFFAV